MAEDAALVLSAASRRALRTRAVVAVVEEEQRVAVEFGDRALAVEEAAVHGARLAVVEAIIRGDEREIRVLAAENPHDASVAPPHFDHRVQVAGGDVQIRL